VPTLTAFSLTFVPTLIVAARRLNIAQELAGSYSNTTAISLDVNDEVALDAAVAEHDVVISLIPYTFHAQVIKSAIKSKTNVVTTSYVSPAMMAYDEAYVSMVTCFYEIWPTDSRMLTYHSIYSILFIVPRLQVLSS